jgi:hypothetical protein
MKSWKFLLWINIESDATKLLLFLRCKIRIYKENKERNEIELSRAIKERLPLLVEDDRKPEKEKLNKCIVNRKNKRWGILMLTCFVVYVFANRSDLRSEADRDNSKNQTMILEFLRNMLDIRRYSW